MMSDDHKAALATGRSQAKAVRAYLEALEDRSRRGRRRTPEAMRERIEEINSSIGDVNALSRLKMVQERLDLTEALEVAEASVAIEDLEDAFVKVAAEYSQNRGIGHAAWREVGVSSSVLKRAGVTRENR